MIDIHAHILPGVDDGSPDMEDSILMADLAVESGVDTIIATPHGNWSEGSSRDLQEREHTAQVRQALKSLRTELKKRSIPLRVLSGMEIYATRDMTQLLSEGILLPMLEGPYILMEFDFQDTASLCTRRIGEVLDAGWNPIIAHPERYECIQRDVHTAREWIRMGCQLQANRGSILGSFGRKPRKAVWELLRAGMITYIGSDAHSPYHRTTYMKDVYELLCDELSRHKARKLTEENAAEYLLGGYE